MFGNFGKTEKRLALTILLTATLPLAVAMILGRGLLIVASSVWLRPRPEVEMQLGRGIDLYKDYIRSVKDDMKDQTEAIAGDEALRHAAHQRDGRACGRALESLLSRHPQLVSLRLEEAETTLASTDRGRPLDDSTEHKLDVRRPLSVDDPGLTVVATFAFDRRFERELEAAGAVRDAYAQLEKERARAYSGYFEVFAVFLGIVGVVSVGLGFLLARGITRRIRRLARAIDQVAAGSLDVRVPVTGSDELTDLAIAFNRMLGEMQQSRARIEYLQRIGAWQEMAQRLAHEIKNPLTPIQLAVQECHRRYSGQDAKFRSLLDATLEIVEEEVGTLRRLVGNFSSFARLPHVELREASLREFLRECSDQLLHLAAESSEDSNEDAIVLYDIDVSWQLPDAPTPVSIDRQMLRRVLINLVRNAVEAIRAASPDAMNGAKRGRVRVHAETTAETVTLFVEDDGPGVPEGVQDRVFDPYFTTKPEGTGLGLAIVKKIVVEHGGAIRVGRSVDLGGACFAVALPMPETQALGSARGGEEPSARLSTRSLAS